MQCKCGYINNEQIQHTTGSTTCMCVCVCVCVLLSPSESWLGVPWARGADGSERGMMRERERRRGGGVIDGREG